jgi:hypothetical protein
MKSHNRALNCCIITVKMIRFVVFVYLVTLKIKATKFNTCIKLYRRQVEKAKNKFCHKYELKASC